MIISWIGCVLHQTRNVGSSDQNQPSCPEHQACYERPTICISDFTFLAAYWIERSSAKHGRPNLCSGLVSSAMSLSVRRSLFSMQAVVFPWHVLREIGSGCCQYCSVLSISSNRSQLSVAPRSMPDVIMPSRSSTV